MRRCRPWLGTFVEISADDSAAVEAGFAAIERIHRLMSAHEPASELSELNRSAPGSPVHLSTDTVEVLRRATFWFEASGGLFDPLRAGCSAIERGAVPTHGGQAVPDHDSNWRDLQIIGHFAWLKRPGCIDLGGIAKGHAVDAAVVALRAASADWGMVNAGGDMAAFGRRQAVDIVDPTTRHAKLQLNLQDRALATSAGLPSHDGLDHAHLPGSGFASVTVEAARCIDADALTKIAFAGASDFRALLDLADARAVALSRSGVVIDLGLDRAA